MNDNMIATTTTATISVQQQPNRTLSLNSIMLQNKKLFSMTGLIEVL